MRLPSHKYIIRTPFIIPGSFGVINKERYYLLRKTYKINELICNI